MLFGLVLIVGGLIAEAVLERVPGLPDMLLGAGAGVLVAKLLFAYADRRGRPMSDVRRRRVEARWVVLGAVVGLAVYMLLR